MTLFCTQQGLDVFRCYVPGQSKQSIESLNLDHEIQRVYGGLLYVCLHVCALNCIRFILHVRVFICVDMSMCFYGECANIHCRLNDMVDTTFSWAPGLCFVFFRF